MHKYLYSDADPVNRLDPSGMEGIVETLGSIGISMAINGLAGGVASYLYGRVVRGYNHAEALAHAWEVAKISAGLAIPYFNILLLAYLTGDLIGAAAKGEVGAKDWGEMVFLAVVLHQTNARLTPAVQARFQTYLDSGQPIPTQKVSFAVAEDVVRAVSNADLEIWRGSDDAPPVGAVAVDTNTGEVFTTYCGKGFEPDVWNEAINDYTGPGLQIPGGNTSNNYPLGNCAEPRMINALLNNGNTIGPNIVMRVFGILGTKKFPTGQTANPCSNCQPLLNNAKVTLIP